MSINQSYKQPRGDGPPTEGKVKDTKLSPTPENKTVFDGDDKYQTNKCHNEHQKVQIAEGKGGT